MSTHHDVIHRLARRQHGAVTTAQLRALGLSPATVVWLAEHGWRRPARGVLVAPGAPPTWEQAAFVAARSCGAEAAASHATAAYLHGLTDERPDVIEVTVPLRQRPRRSFVVHRSVDLDECHVTRRLGIPVTTVERTLVDGGLSSPLGRVGRWFDSALRRRLTTPQEVGRLLLSVAERGRNGITVARCLVEERMGWTERTESELEDRFLRVVHGAGLPRPVAQWTVMDAHGGFIGRADFGWPDERVGVELDGYAFHTDPTAFRLDRVRQNRIILAGITLLRFTWWDVDLRPEMIVSALRSALGFCGHGGGHGMRSRPQNRNVQNPSSQDPVGCAADIGSFG
jgi:hypothetical protein